jgi:hypothetical protein
MGLRRFCHFERRNLLFSMSEVRCPKFELVSQRHKVSLNLLKNALLWYILQNIYKLESLCNERSF